MEILITIYILSILIWWYKKYTVEEVKTIEDFLEEGYIILTIIPFFNTIMLLIYFLLKIGSRLPLSNLWNKFLKIRIKNETSKE